MDDQCGIGPTGGPEIRVLGTGQAQALPRIARLDLVVVARERSLAEALSSGESAVARVRAALVAAGTEPVDTTTDGLSVQAEQSWSEGGGPQVVGFRADHGLRVLVRDLQALGPVLGGALAAGGDLMRVNGVDFAVEDEEPLRRQARESAWADALGRARHLAGLAGRELGPVNSIVESPVRGEAVALGGVRVLSAGSEPDIRPAAVRCRVELAVNWALR
jgi:uncharacterized protein